LQVNAACLPGGKVVVFKGLLDLFKHDETALAVVLCHEAGHVIARHGAEQLGFANLLLWYTQIYMQRQIARAVKRILSARSLGRCCFLIASKQAAHVSRTALSVKIQGRVRIKSRLQCKICDESTCCAGRPPPLLAEARAGG